MNAPSRNNSVLMIGETLLVLQRFEQYLLAVLLCLVSASVADAKLEAVLLRDKETLGTLLRHFGKRVSLPEQFGESFDRLLKNRNIFVHKLFLEPWFDLRSKAGLVQLNKFLWEIRADAKVALHVMISTFYTLKSEPLSSDAKALVADILRRIEMTAEPDFGGLTEAQYVVKVVKNAVENFQVKQNEV